MVRHKLQSKSHYSHEVCRARRATKRSKMIYYSLSGATQKHPCHLQSHVLPFLFLYLGFSHGSIDGALDVFVIIILRVLL